MLEFIQEKSKCTGCGACASICPTGSISFAYDDEGFAYPEADSTCIDCGKCYNVCPVLNYSASAKTRFKQFCVAARHVDHSVWEKSSSGGAFSAICKAYCNDGDVIFGAKFEDLKVVHDYVCSPDEIGGFMKSKYVQSDLRDNYHKTKRMLESNRRVLFSGTPCQIAGLRSFLERDYSNLLCIDLICHGVGSPGIFQEYVNYLEAKYGSKVTSFTFRNQKLKMWQFFDHIIRVDFENGTTIEDGADLYNTGFIQCLFLRPSCSECKFANLSRVGDITLGDFRNQYELLPELRGSGNLSTIIVNTEKGNEVFNLLGQYMNIYFVPMEDVINMSLQLREPSPMSENREEFFSDLLSGIPIEQALKNHVVVNSPGLTRRIWLMIPGRVRARIKRQIKWIRK